ncbi:MAG: hypothetical protein SGPRY_001691, partial [Prymnesium sp.]
SSLIGSSMRCFLLLLALARGELQCPSGGGLSWRLAASGERCYGLLPSSLCSFNCCIEECRRNGASLPCVRGDEDQRELTERTRRHGSWWVGLYQPPTHDQRTTLGWNSWAAANCSSTYTNWDKDEPSDRDCVQQNCAVSSRVTSIFGSSLRKYAWEDERCDASKLCVCEWPGRPSEAVLMDVGRLQKAAGQSLPRSSGCLFGNELDSFAGLRLLLPLGVLLCTAAMLTSVIRHKRRRARELISRSMRGGHGVPFATVTRRGVDEPQIAHMVPFFVLLIALTPVFSL